MAIWTSSKSVNQRTLVGIVLIRRTSYTSSPLREPPAAVPCTEASARKLDAGRMFNFRGGILECFKKCESKNLGQDNFNKENLVPLRTIAGARRGVRGVRGGRRGRIAVAPRGLRGDIFCGSYCLDLRPQALIHERFANSICIRSIGPLRLRRRRSAGPLRPPRRRTAAGRRDARRHRQRCPIYNMLDAS